MSYDDWPDIVTPKHIATKLGLGTQRPDKKLRDWLRANRPIPHNRYQRWEFTPAQADEIVRRYWRPS